jgi:3-oxoadipate enol-lactonase
MAAWRTEYVGSNPRICIDVVGRGPLVVFLHGLGGNRSNWHDQLPAFAAHFTAVAWDARGYGGSDDFAGPFLYEDVCRDLLGVIDHFGARRAFLVGLSMGGRIALDFYGRYPDRVAAIVFADTSARPGHPPTAAQREEALRLRRKPFEDGLGARAMAENLAATLIGPNATAEMRERIVESCGSVHPESYLKSLETIIGYADVPPFASIAIPSLVIVGSKDQLATPDYARRMAAELQNARAVVLEGAGHLSNIEAPAAFNEAAIAFLLAQAQPAIAESR